MKLSILAELKDIGFAPAQGQKMTKESTDLNPSANNPERNWLAIMAIVSIGYILLFAVLFHLVTPKPYDCAYGYFPCLRANEFGDLVAGVFAPLAFLWLVAAVLVQSQELQEQRKELSLTREEMKLQRGEFEQSRLVAIESKGVAEAQAKAADAQADAAITNAKAAETQNKILKEQLDAQRQDRSDQQLTQLLDELYSMFAERLNGWIPVRDEKDEIIFNGMKLWYPPLPKGKVAALLTLCPRAFTELQKYNSEGANFTLVATEFDSDWRRVSGILNNILIVSEGASTSQQQLVGDLLIEYVHSELVQLLVEERIP